MAMVLPAIPLCMALQFILQHLPLMLVMDMALVMKHIIPNH